jgi:hypothetical protein
MTHRAISMATKRVAGRKPRGPVLIPGPVAISFLSCSSCEDLRRGPAHRSGCL